MYFNLMSDAAGIVTGPIDEYKKSRDRSPANFAPTSHQGSMDSDTYGLVANRDLNHQHTSRNGARTAGAMAAASAKSLGNTIGRPFQSIFVGVPLAVADGLNAVPKLYGSEVRERDKITDFKSGTIVAAKSFVTGIADGLADLVVEPYRGSKNEGALGFAKGLGKGGLGFLAKTGSGKCIRAFNLKTLKTKQLTIRSSRIRSPRISGARCLQKHLRKLPRENSRYRCRKAASGGKIFFRPRSARPVQRCGYH